MYKFYKYTYLYVLDSRKKPVNQEETQGEDAKLRTDRTLKIELGDPGVVELTTAPPCCLVL